MEMSDKTGEMNDERVCSVPSRRHQVYSIKETSGDNRPRFPRKTLKLLGILLEVEGGWVI